MFLLKKHIFRKSLLFFLFIFTLQLVTAQEAPVPVAISSEKVIIDGKFYYLHTVKEKQTFYSICKAYAISSEKVLLANPGLIPTDLKINQVIKIPFVREIETSTVSETEDFYYHKVEKGETLFSLQQKYNISSDIIKKYNPDIYGDNIGIGQVIKIPKNNTAVAETAATQSDSLYNYYYVKPGDRLFRIAKRFDIRVADIVEINKGLRFGLKPGEKLLIPKEKFALYEPEFKQDTTVILGKPTLTISQCDSIRRVSNIENVKVALFLPFGVIEDITYDTLIIEKKDTTVKSITKQVTRYSDGIVEFYEGLLLAADSLRKQGTAIQISVFNTNGDTNQTRQYLEKLRLNKPDIIFGPVKDHNIKIVSEYAKLNGIIQVLPFTNETSYIQNHPTCFELFPTDKFLYNEKAKYLASLENTNIYFISKRDSLLNKKVEKFDSLVNYYAGIYHSDSLETFHFYFDDSTSSHLYENMRVSKLNMVVPVFAERNEREESDVITIYSMFYAMRDRYNISVMGNYNWQTFNNQRIEPYHDFKTHLISPFYIDYKNHKTIEFAKFCVKKLGYEPFRTVSTGMGFNFAYLGFESGMLFINAFANYGSFLPSCYNFLYNAGNQSLYKFTQIQNGLGFYNSSYTLLLYDDDYEVKILKRE